MPSFFTNLSPVVRLFGTQSIKGEPGTNGANQFSNTIQMTNMNYTPPNISNGTKQLKDTLL